jgi:hypothetical protein
MIPWMRTPFRHPWPPADGAPAVARDAPAETARDTPLLPSAVPPRNFTVTSEDRVRGILRGLPAYVRRKRRIEDLEAELATALDRLDHGDSVDTGELRARIDARLELLHRLVDLHNRYYPVEANLPTDVRTGRFLEAGEPWAPMVAATLTSLRRRGRGPAR